MRQRVNQLKLGVCYYPEHWDQSLWQQDAKRMAAIGLNYVRLAEFAWSRYEPTQGNDDFAWLDKAIDILANEGLKIVMCTPTATPPSWLIEKYPEVLPYDKNGNPRNFGSRCHYTFSSSRYTELSSAITEKIAKRYGKHPAVVAWQTDNEYGNHNSVYSYGPIDLKAFRQWLEQKYTNIEELNRRWGNAFWSMDYTSFDQIPLPHSTVTQANPIHSLDFARFSSEMVIRFNQAQIEILRSYCPDIPLTHNFMAYFGDFDHFALCHSLDVASWDNYPLGFLDSHHFNSSDQTRYHNVGHPDISAFFHDLYRACGKDNLWIMEQQPGPVNWAPHNPIPLGGMVRLWGWQAFAHGADLVSYFRWRQAPYAQEQMHAGLLMPNNEEAPAYGQIAQLNEDRKTIPHLHIDQAEVAILFDYETLWLLRTQPQGANFNYYSWVFDCYQALRRLGVNIDFVSTSSSFKDYKLIIIPTLPIIREATLTNISQAKAHFLWGPRSGSKTEDFQIPAQLPPGPLNSLIPIRITEVGSLRDEIEITGQGSFGQFSAYRWKEIVLTKLNPQAKFSDGNGAFYSHNNHHYLAGLLKPASLRQLLIYLFKLSNIQKEELNPDVRRRSCGELDFIFNFGPQAHKLDQQEVLLGSESLNQGQFAVIKKK